MYTEIRSILQHVHQQTKSSKLSNFKCRFAEEFPLLSNQALYTVDFQEKKICYQKGIEQLLGYQEHEFNFSSLSTIIHPDDVKRYSEIMRYSLIYALENPIKPFDIEFILSYRMQKKDGSFIRVLRNSTVADVDQRGLMVTNFSTLTDISFMSKSTMVEWSFSTKNEDLKKDFMDYVESSYKNYFSPRQIEILTLLKQGHKSIEIAEKLSISKHTVDTQRRKMLQKCGCKNTPELIEFALQNAIFS